MLKKSKRIFYYLLVIGGIIFSVYLFRAPIMTSFANYLVYAEKPQKADAIIILAGDPTSQREDYGVYLYKKGYAPRIIVSGGVIGSNVTYAKIMKNYLMRAGVSAKHIEIEDRSTSTYENALYSLPVVLAHKFKSVLLVTSPYHSRRSFQTFNRFFSKHNIKVISCPADQSWFRSENWWTREDDTEVVLQEYFKMIFYGLKGR